MYGLQLAPKVYQLAIDKETEQEMLVPIMNSYNIQGKNYGDTEAMTELFWNSYTSDARSSMGVLLTGGAGTGKSRMGEMLCNKSIANGQPVIKVSELKVTSSTIKYLASLPPCTILFDEFGKWVTVEMQNKMLGLFSDVNTYGRKLFIITENEQRSVSPYIINRPGRARYHIDFSKMDKDVLMEYCTDYRVDNVFMEDLLETYIKAKTFSFDFLQCLVKEHIMTPNVKLEKLLKYLNMSTLINIPLLASAVVTHIDTGTVVKNSFRPREAEDFLDYGWRLPCRLDRKMLNKDATEEEKTIAADVDDAPMALMPRYITSNTPEEVVVELGKFRYVFAVE